MTDPSHDDFVPLPDRAAQHFPNGARLALPA